MLMPLLSVTIIGLGVGLVLWVVRGRMVGPIVSSLLGAWAGFLVGAPFGLAVDVVARTGDRFVVVSHLSAAAGAVVAAVREHQLASRDRYLDAIEMDAEVRQP